MKNHLRKLLRICLNRYPFDFGHDKIFNWVDKYSFKKDEELTYVRGIGCLMYLDPKTYLARHIYYFGTYEPMCVKFLKRILKPGMVFYDIGANFGFYSLLAAQRIAPNGAVFAFEPQSKCCSMLIKSMAANKLKNIRIHQIALSDEDGEGRIYQLSETNIGQASLWRGKGKTFGSEVVKCVTIDYLIKNKELPPCDIMKIDVEGAEQNVLKGANELFLKSPPKVIVFEGIDVNLKRFDSSLDELLRTLKKNNYKIVFAKRGRWHPFISMSNYERKGSPPDFLAIHNSYIDRVVDLK